MTFRITLTVSALISTSLAQKAEELPTEKPARAEIVEEAPETEADDVAEEAPEKFTLHSIKPGGSLTAVSEEAYGRTRYWRILKLYNKVDPSKLQVGQPIKAPDIPWLLNSSGLEAKFPKAVAGILKAKNILTTIQDKNATLTEDDRKEIKGAADLIAEARDLLGKEVAGVSGKPLATVKQLRTVHSHLLHISNNTRQGRTDPNSLAHEHLSNAIVYGVLWAQGGFR